MNAFLSLDTIKRENDDLYLKIFANRERLTKDTERRKLIAEINALLEKIKNLSEKVDSFDDYRWLGNTVVKWQSVLTDFFDTPEMILLPEPKGPWRPPNSSYFSEKEIKDWISGHAAFIAYTRCTVTGRWDNEDCWHTAETFWASEVLNGRINMVSRISPLSYSRLEGIWVKEVKLQTAYFEWLRNNKELFHNHDRDFFFACDHIREMLVNHGIKAFQSEFNTVKEYLESKYLDPQGYLFHPDDPNSEAHKLIDSKAYRIYETTGFADEKKNWEYAETYVKMFYENIIPAVFDKDEEKILRILKSFQYSKMNRFLIINCFETALAFYFLDPDIIKRLWDQSAEEPTPVSTVESTVNVTAWPSNFVQFFKDEPCQHRFWCNENQIGFRGVMLDVEREDLLFVLEKASGGIPNPGHIQAIYDLCKQSRLIHKEATL